MTARTFNRASPTVTPVITALTQVNELVNELNAGLSERKHTDPELNEATLNVDPLVEARAALSRSNIYVLRKLTVEREHDGREHDGLVLRGNVESFYHKQLAQELVRTAVGGVKVTNLLVVVYTHKPDLFFETR